MDKIRKDVVAVGGADQLADGHPHLFGIIGRENVAEVAGGHAHIDGIPFLDPALLQQIAVGGDVVDDLRQDTAPVDGVGGGEKEPPPRQGIPQGRIGKEPFHPCLGVVKIAYHGTDAHVVSLLSLHLKLLDIGDAVLGIEHQDTGLIHVLEALQRGFAGVAGGGHQDAHCLLLLIFHQRGGKEMRQHL